jgi:hypothetical protein
MVNDQRTARLLPSPRHHGNQGGVDMIILSRIARVLGRVTALAFAVTLAIPAFADDGRYTVTKLVADLPGVAAQTDANLVNGWGIAMLATSPIWVSNNGTGTSTLYNGAGTAISPPSPVTIPAASGAGQGVPTGMTSNPSTNDFLLAGAGTAARFLWASSIATSRRDSRRSTS